MKELCISLINALTGAVCAVIGAERFRRLAALFLSASDKGAFATFSLRPRSADQVATVSDSLKQAKRTGVILQGGLMNKDGFTLETLKIYKRLFRGQPLILSTWKGEDEGVLRTARELGAECVLSEKPPYAGVSNINLQIVSSRAGVKKARELGCEYALKTRTDQRIYAPDVDEYFRNLLDAFPVSGAASAQKKRIAGISLNTFKYRMYGLSDMTIFGHIDDMLLYWDISTDDRVFNKEEREAPRTLASYSKWRVCEVYLATEFLKKIGRELRWTLADSWSAFRDNFCVVDKEQLDLFWPKYGRAEYRWRSYRQNYRTQEITFRDWFNIYRGLDNRAIDERLLEQ